MTIIAGIIATLAGLAGSAGALAFVGGPVGIAVAWLGSMAANKTVKLVVIGVGLLVLVCATVGVTVHVQHLKRDADAFKVLSAEQDSLEARYGCGARPPHERDLAACLTARERDAALAMAAEIARQRAEAVSEAAKRARDEAQARDDEKASDQAIEQFAAQGDGRVPAVLLQMWKRERADRGIK